jgi:hypothetical protein
MAEMARSVKRIRPTDIHDSPDTFCKICSLPYWLIAVLQCGQQMCHRVFQVLPDGMDNFVEGIAPAQMSVNTYRKKFLLTSPYACNFARIMDS